MVTLLALEQYVLRLSIPLILVSTILSVGQFQPISSAFSLLGEYDMILGMAFCETILIFSRPSASTYSVSQCAMPIA